MFKKITSMVLAGVMAVSVMASVTAADINQSGGSGDSKVMLDINPRNLKVTVPSVLPIWVDSDNNVTVATNAKIQNRSEGPVDVTDVSVEADNNWSLVNFSTDFTKIPVDTKQYGMTMYNDDVIDGVNLSLFDRIDGSDEIAVVYDGNVAIQSSDINKFDIGHVVFTVAWANGPKLGINDIAYDIENDAVQAYLANPAYDDNDYSYTYMTSFSGTNRRPAQGVLEVPSGAASITVAASDGKSFTKPVSGRSFKVDSLIPNQTYTYQMKDSSGEVVKQGKIYPTGAVRMINGYIGGSYSAQNVRDLGGWRADGGKLKYGTVYRGGTLQNVTEAGKAFFKDFLGVQAQLNLRGQDEELMEMSSLGSDVDWLNVPAGNYTLNQHYSDSDSGTVQMVKSIRFILDELRQGKPVYLHCEAGMDRTETIAFILEAVCGVSQSDIDRDYELSFSESRVRCGHATMNPLNKYPNMIQSLKDECLGSNVRDRVINALLNHGITMSEINELRHLMIDGNPVTLRDESFDAFDVSAATLQSRLNSDGTVASYTDEYGDGGSLAVTDFIAIEPNDVITVSTDLPQTGDYHCQTVFYDADHNKLYNNGSGNGEGDSYYEWNDSRTVGYIRPMRVSRYKTAVQGAKYVRICVGYKDIDNVSINIHRY